MLIRSALFTVLVACLLAPAGAAAQAPPPDEQAAARAFADAAKHLEASVGALELRLDTTFRRRPVGCPHVLQHFHGPARDNASALLTVHQLRVVGRLVTPLLTAFRTELANAQTRDPALLSGRAAWRQAGRAYAALRKPGDICAELRAYRRAGAPDSAVRDAVRELRPVIQLTEGKEFGRKVKAAVRRMVELGVPKAEAEKFKG